MFDLAALASAIGQLADPVNIVLMLAGTALGIIAGVLPGIGAPLGIAIALPFTFYLTGENAFSLLLGIYAGAIYGGSISAVVLGIPGTPPAAATVLDGHPLFRQGKANQALTLSLIASVFGGLFSTLVLALGAPVLASQALRFGPPEYFVLGVVGVSVVGRISGESVLKGLIMGGIGVFLTTVGIDPVGGRTRFLFGSYNLYGGIPFIPFLVGLFALPEMLDKAETAVRGMAIESIEKLRIKMPKLTELWPSRKVFLRSSIIGTIAGIIPGQGGAIGAFLSYGEAKRRSKDPERFGNGHPDGVIAAEAANNATTGGALVPTLTLGVPGSAAAAVLLGALMMQGLDPGPRLFSEQPQLIYYIFVSLLVVNVLLLPLGRISIAFAQKIVAVPDRFLVPIVLLLAFVGSFATTGNVFGVWIALVFGAFGYVVRKFGFPIVPIVLGFILGDMIEVGFRSSLTLSRGNLGIFFTRPIALGLWGLLIAIFAGPPIIRLLKNRKGDRTESS